MNFIKLLMAGTTMFGFKPRPLKYEMAEGQALPKFGPIAKPNNPAPVPETKTQDTGSLFDRKPGLESPGLRAEAQSGDEKRSGGGKAVARFANSWNRMEDFSCDTSETPKSKFQFSALFAAENVAKASRRLVQAELALDSVRVVRNDLNDTDMELIAIEKRKTSTAQAKDQSNPRIADGKPEPDPRQSASNHAMASVRP